MVDLVPPQDAPPEAQQEPPKSEIAKAEDTKAGEKSEPPRSAKSPPNGDPSKTEPPKPGRQAEQKPAPKNEPKKEIKSEPPTVPQDNAEERAATAARLAWMLNLPVESSASLAAPPSEEKANLTSEQIAAFKAQVRKCWVAPPGTPNAPDVKVIMRIALSPDGMLGAAPELIAAPLEVDGRPLRDSAKRALQKCQPYAGLPSDKYKDWKILDLTFTAEGPAGLSGPHPLDAPFPTPRLALSSSPAPRTEIELSGAHLGAIDMLTLYFTPGACSLAPHIVLEESGEPYQKQMVDLANGEQRTEPYLKINPQGRVPALRLDDGEALTENTAILPYLGKRFGLWPRDPIGEARALSMIGFFAASVHPAHAHIGRPERYATDPAAYPTIREAGLKSFHGYLQQIDGMLAGREWFAGDYSVLDAYGLVFYAWGFRRELPLHELTAYTAHKDRMLARPAVRRVAVEEKLALARDLAGPSRRARQVLTG